MSDHGVRGNGNSSKYASDKCVCMCVVLYVYACMQLILCAYVCSSAAEEGPVHRGISISSGAGAGVGAGVGVGSGARARAGDCVHAPT